jgi:hypothetical protein
LSGRPHVLILLALSVAALISVGPAAQTAERSTSDSVTLPSDHPVRIANDMIGLIGKRLTPAPPRRHRSSPFHDFRRNPQSNSVYVSTHTPRHFAGTL